MSETAETVNPQRNRWTFAVGTLGRDMVYALVSSFMIFYLTDVANLDDTALWWVSGLVLGTRLVDAVLDIVMGGIVDNTRSRWGHYKPWILIGCVASAVFTILLFTDLGLRDTAFILGFAGIYLGWSLSWSANDIPYWSLLPSLTLDQSERERIGALTKVFATLGLFAVVVAIIPVTKAWTPTFGSQRAWTMFAIAVALIMVAGQLVTLFGVKEPGIVVEQERTSLREIASVVLKNDQLLWTAISMVLFMTGYVTTTSFGVYFFKYVYRDEGMYAPFAAVLGVAQLIGFLVFPFFSARFDRRQLYTGATITILVGYVVFFFAPMNMIWIGLAGLLLFLGQSFVTLLMLVFISDTIEYGQWKLGRRNGAVTFALQPFINKVGAALAGQIVGVTIIVSGINAAATPDDVTPAGVLLTKIVMLIVPMVLIVAGYLIYRAKYRIDKAFYDQIVAELKQRGQFAG